MDGEAVDARGAERVLTLSGNRLLAGRVAAELPGADLTRRSAGVLGPLEPAGELSGAHAGRWLALALVVTCADLLGTARGAHALACEYAKVRTQYGKTIGSYQAVAHPLAEGLALIEKPGRAPPPGPVGVRGVDAAAGSRAASAADDERREHRVRPGSLRRGQGARGSGGRRAGGGLDAGDDGRRPRT